MLTINRWHVILVGVIILLLSLAQLAHYNAYDTDVLRYVSAKINKEDGSYAAATTAAAAVAAATTVQYTVTVTHTVAGPTTTEVRIVENDPEPCQEQTALWAEPFVNMNTTITVPEKPIIFDPKGPRADQIIILTATDGGGHNQAIENVVERANGNRQIWADHHGYTHHFINITKYDLNDVPAVWKKLPAIVETFNTFPDAQWVFFLDLDAIIMSPEVDLQSLILSKEGMRKNFLPGAELMVDSDEHFKNYFPREPDFENVDLIIAQDHNGLNAGSFLMRRSQFTQWLLDLWADPFLMYATFTNKEQDALRHLMKHHPTVRKHTGIARQRSINAFPDGGDWMKWQKGDLLVHFAGCWVDDACSERWERLWAQRSFLGTE